MLGDVTEDEIGGDRRHLIEPGFAKLSFDVVFPGEGAQYPGMLADLAIAFPVVRQWFDFWENLETGYQWFEEKKVPPNVTVKEKRYTFE